jgi:hypothetical protein
MRSLRNNHNIPQKPVYMVCEYSAPHDEWFDREENFFFDLEKAKTRVTKLNQRWPERVFAYYDATKPPVRYII